jgi:short-subunit dehydrogenase
VTVIAITGGGRGIGAATAQALAARGARVAIGDIDPAELPGVLSLPLDVTDSASYRRFLDDVSAQLGPLDVLVANAGVMWVGPFDQEPETAMRRQLAVNVEGVITGFKLATPAMRQRGSGHVVVVASAASKLAPAGEATYAATKHAVYGYCTAVREELRGTGVDVSVLMPTVVATDLAAGTSSGKVALLTPEQVAAGVVALVDSRKPELFLPRKARLAALAMAFAPVRLHRLLIPNQVVLGRPDERRAYETRTLDTPDP